MKIMIILALAGGLYGQRILYNQDLDKKGQEAAGASKKIASDPLTSKEVQNLKTIEKQQIDGALKAGYVTMRTQIQSFDNWTIVSRTVCTTLRQLYAADQIQALLVSAERANHETFDRGCTRDQLRQDKVAFTSNKMTARSAGEVGRSINSLAARIRGKVQDVKTKTIAKPEEGPGAKGAKASKDQKAATSTEKVINVTASTKATLDAAVERVGNVEELLKAAQEIKNSGGVQKVEGALEKIEEGLKQVDALIDSVHGIWSAYAGIQVDPRSLVPSKEKLGASLLALEADRIKELAAIRAADVLYLMDLQKRLEDCMEILSRMGLWFSPYAVEATLSAAGDSNRRVNMLYCLHLAAAGAAVNQTPFATESIRESITHRRYAIRRDAIYNGAYEQALQASGLRLSAYYAAGITKGQVAQLFYYLSGLVSLPKLAF